jgi:hypothetical protein
MCPHSQRPNELVLICSRLWICDWKEESRLPSLESDPFSQPTFPTAFGATCLAFYGGRIRSSPGFSHIRFQSLSSFFPLQISCSYENHILQTESVISEKQTIQIPEKRVWFQYILCQPVFSILTLCKMLLSCGLIKLGVCFSLCLL